MDCGLSTAAEGLVPPRIDLSNYAWYPQPGPQTAAYCARWVNELFYGGARGGGKSDFMLGDFLQDVPTYANNWRGIFFRRTYDELEEVIYRSHELFPRTGATWGAVKRTWFWPNGAFLKMRYLERLQDAERYQGHQYTIILFDELTNWPDPGPYDVLKACLRNAQVEIPFKRIRASGNPGGAGHNWVKDRFVDPSPLGYEPIYDERSKMIRMYIPARVRDNLELMRKDPEYVNRLAGTGSPELVRCWLEGDWNVVVGAYFPEFSILKHVISPFEIPPWWTRFVAMDWGSAKPFAIGWWAVSDGTIAKIPRGALICYREWYGASNPNVGLKLENPEIARGILAREQLGERILYRVIDPACFQEDGGPSVAEQINRHLPKTAKFSPADNKRLPGWAELRSRLVGEAGDPMIFWFSTCTDAIRTLPAIQHDRHRPEDVDTDGEDHMPDQIRYACMSRPWIKTQSKIVPMRGIARATIQELINERIAANKRRKRI